MICLVVRESTNNFESSYFLSKKNIFLPNPSRQLLVRNFSRLVWILYFCDLICYLLNLFRLDFSLSMFSFYIGEYIYIKIIAINVKVTYHCIFRICLKIKICVFQELLLFLGYLFIIYFFEKEKSL